MLLSLNVLNFFNNNCFLIEIDLPNDHYLWKLNETDKGKIESNGVFTAEKTPGDV